MVERGEAKCEYKRFDDCDHFDFSFRMRYPKPTVNANASMVATERKRPNVNANIVMTINNSILFPDFFLHRRKFDHPVVGLFVVRGLVHLHQRVRHHWEEEFILAGLTVQALGRDWRERINWAAHGDWIQRLQTNLANYETENFWV